MRTMGINLILMRTFFLIIYLCGCSHKNKKAPSGEFILNNHGKGDLFLYISKNRSAPWRLRFDLEKNIKASNNSKVKLFLRNEDNVDLSVYISNKIGDVVILPKKSFLIFEGTLDELMMCGRTENEELTIKSSRDRDVRVKFLVDAQIEHSDLKLKVMTWALQYGL